MILRGIIFSGLVVVALLASVGVSQTQQSRGPVARPAAVMPEVIPVPAAAQPEHFDADAATNAYLAEIPASARVPTLTLKADTG